MSGRCDQDQPVTRHRNNRQTATRFRECNNAEFDGAVEDVADNASRSGIFEIDLCRWKLGHELAHLCRQLVKTDAIYGRNLDRPADLTNQTSQTLFKMAVAGEHVPRLSVKDLPCRRQAYLTAT